MFKLKIELSGRNRTAFFGIDIGGNGAQSSSNELQVSDELEACAEHVGIPDIDILKKVEDEWVKAGIIV